MILENQNRLLDGMSFEKFNAEVKIVSRPIRSGPEAANNVVLEGSPAVVDRLTSAELVYVKWFFIGKGPITSFMCLGINHWVTDCEVRAQEFDRVDVHMTSPCSNEVPCRNCAVREVLVGHIFRSMFRCH